MSLQDVVVVGGSTAGATAMRELRRRGFDGRLTLVDPADGTNRPPLSKAVLAAGVDDAELIDGSVLIDHSGLDVRHDRAADTGLDPVTRQVMTSGGGEHRYDALVIACGSRARRIAAPGQSGEVELRTLADARELRRRMLGSASVAIVGAGFLGLEVATAAARSGTAVTVIDPDPPLHRLLGPHLAGHLVDRAVAMGVVFRQSSATLVGGPVSAVELGDGTVVEADLVVSCVGDVPETEWLAGTGLATPLGIEIDRATRTAAPDVHAIGDVAAVRSGGTVRRAPYWANAVTQGRVAAATVLGQEADDPIVDEYFWTEIAGLSLKVVGPLPLVGAPTTLEDAGDGRGILAWDGPTIAALGVRRPVPRLRAMARDLVRL